MASTIGASVASASQHQNMVHQPGELQYLSGFGNEHASEALAGALPVGQNSPQKVRAALTQHWAGAAEHTLNEAMQCPYGLYAEQLSGTAFTVPRGKNLRSWLYRIRPSVLHERFVPVEHPTLISGFGAQTLDPNQVRRAIYRRARARDAAHVQMRWLPMPLPGEKVEQDFVDGIVTMAGQGDPSAKSGLAVHMYSCNTSMADTCLSNSDGDFLIVPQVGTLHLQTEFGFLDVAPKEIVVIPRGIKFRVSIDEPSRGYILEVYNGHFQLPELGPLGSNGLAHPRDFHTPVAAFEDRDVDYVVINKFGGGLFSTIMRCSPFNVVAWHGNYTPFKYDLSRFNTINTVSFDHPDPSIFTVLTCPSDTPGVALADFVVFPPRWMVAEHTFRPPYFHRNVMTEFMGMIWGKYDAKVGFQPGGASLHSCMTPHGPDLDTFTKASAAALAPEFLGGGLAFMFETNLMLRLTQWALHAPHRDVDYQKCWQQLPRVFDPTHRDVSKLVIKAKPIAGAVTGSASGGVTETGHQTHTSPKPRADTAAGPAASDSATSSEPSDGKGKRKRGTAK